MRSHLGFTPEEVAWRRSHEPDLHPTLSRHLRRRLMRHAHRARMALGPLKTMPAGPHGFDISSYQPAGPNFRVGGRAFAIFKATEGTGYFDPHFAANRAAAHAQGCIAIGLYHFARPGSHPAATEAAYFLAHVGAPQPGEFAILDYEVPPWSEAWIADYIAHLHAAGWNVAFYTYAGMAAANPTSQVRASTPYYWPAGYSSSPPSADRWADIGWTIWQHTDGAGPSADGPWDCSVAVLAMLMALARSAAPAPPPPPPPPKPKFVSEEESMFYPADRRVDAAQNPVAWVSDHDGKSHPFVYDIDGNEDGHRLGPTVVTSWLWVRTLVPGSGPGGRSRISIWSQGKGRWLDGEVSPDGWAAGEDRGWAVPTGGIHSVVSLDDVPLKVQIERNLIPA